MRRDGWTESEDAALRDLYPRIGAPGAALQIGRTLAATKSRARLLGLRGVRTRARVWTSEREEVLRAAYTAGGLRAAQSALPELSRSAVKQRALALKLRRPSRAYSAADDAAIREHYGRTRDATRLARELGRTAAAIRHRAFLLGVRSERTWSPAEVEAVRAGYATRGAAALATELIGSAGQLEMRAVYTLAARLGVTTSPAHAAGVWERVRELHSQGLSDADIGREMADAFGGRNAREKVMAIRTRRLKLAPNPVDRAKCVEAVRKQMATLGLSGPHELRDRAHKALAERYGLPADLRLRQVQIVLALARGPNTAEGLKAALGMTSMTCNQRKPTSAFADRSPATSYLSDLARRGLVASIDLGTNRGPRRSYSLTPLAMDLLAGATPDPEARP